MYVIVKTGTHVDPNIFEQQRQFLASQLTSNRLPLQGGMGVHIS